MIPIQAANRTVHFQLTHDKMNRGRCFCSDPCMILKVNISFCHDLFQLMNISSADRNLATVKQQYGIIIPDPVYTVQIDQKTLMTPEEAFIKMGKPELIKKYRKNGDYLKNDPRITKFGRFIRKTSIDELPQLVNILKGDISLIGPRSLLPGELRDYGDRSLLLTVKSGLTGFAQVSGRRDISFEERRALDIYYVMNWSLMLDLQIFFRTIKAVVKRDGAK